MAGGFDKTRSPEQLNWTDVDVTTLPKALQTVYNQYKEVARLAATRREEFNTAFKHFIRESDQVEIADEQSLVIGHNFGKLSFAVSDKPEKERRSSRQAMSFGAPTPSVKKARIPKGSARA